MMGRVNQIAQRLEISQLAFSAGVCVISSENYCTCGHETGGISLHLLFRWFRRAVTTDRSSTGEAERLRQFHGHMYSFCLVGSRAVYFQHSMPIPQMWGSLPRYFPSACSRLGASA